MFSVHKLFLLLLLAAFLKCCCGAHYVSYDDGVISCDREPVNSTTEAFKTNLNSLLTILEEKSTENYGFYMEATGMSPDRLYGLVQCRGDVSSNDCRTCLQKSFEWAHTKCTNSVYAAVWFDWCFLRYSQMNFLGKQINSTKIVLRNITSDTDDINTVIKGSHLMRLLSNEVPNQPFRFKTDSVDVGNDGMRYGLVQCNRDLSKFECKNCTGELLKVALSWIRNPSSCLAYSYGCRMWYDDYKFYFNYTLPTVAPKYIPLPSDSSMQLQLSFSAAIAMLLSFLLSSFAL